MDGVIKVSWDDVHGTVEAVGQSHRGFGWSKRSASTHQVEP